MTDETVVEDQVVDEPGQEGGDPVEAPEPGQEGSSEQDEVVEDVEPEQEAQPRLSDHDQALKDHKGAAAENHATKLARKRAANNRETA